MKIDQSPVYPFLAGIALAVLVWVAARMMGGSHLIGAVMGLIALLICILALLITTNAFGARVSVILFSGLFSLPLGAVLGSFLGDVAGACLGMAAGLFFGAFLGDLFFQVFLFRPEPDQEKRYLSDLLEKAGESHRLEDFSKEIGFLKELFNSGKDKLPARTALRIGQVFEENLYRHEEAAYWYRKSIAESNREGNREENLFAREAGEGLSRLAALKESKKNTPVEDLVEAKELIEAGSFEAAEKKLMDLERLYPDNAEVNYLYAHFFLYRHNPGMAEEHLDRCLQKDPGHVLAAYHLACARQELELLVKAKRDFGRYIEMAGDDPEESGRVEESRNRIRQIEEALNEFALDGESRIRS